MSEKLLRYNLTYIIRSFSLWLKKKKTVHRIQMTEGKRQIIQQLLQEYNIETTADIQAALRDLLGGTIKEIMESEMDQHLGYQKSERSDSDDYRYGYNRHSAVEN